MNSNLIIVSVYLDGKVIANYKGPIQAVGLWDGWSAPNSAFPVLIVGDDPVTFHRVMVKRTHADTVAGPIGSIELDGYPLGDKASEPPARIKTVALYKDKKWYWLNDTGMSYPDAQALARSMGGRLLEIKSQEEQNFIVPKLKDEWTWLGLIRRHQSRTWINDRLQEHTFFRWGNRQPKVGTWDFLLTINRDGSWHDTWDRHRAAVCVEWGPE